MNRKILSTLLTLILISINVFSQNELGKLDDTQRIAIKPYFLKSKFALITCKPSNVEFVKVLSNFVIARRKSC